MFIESIAKVDEKNAYISNFGGDKTTDSWTDKLMSKGKEEPKQVLAQGCFFFFFILFFVFCFVFIEI